MGTYFSYDLAYGALRKIKIRLEIYGGARPLL
jgi:hypothetical protein